MAVLPPMEIDPEISALENLISLLNRDNKTNVTADDVTIGLPRDYNDPFDRNNRNTQVDVTGEPGTPYEGTYTFRYWRNDLNRILDDVVIDLDLLDDAEIPYSTVEQLKRYVCQHFKLIPDEVYFTTETVPSPDFENPTVTLLLAAKLGSYTYTRSGLVTLTRGKIDLGDIWDGGDDGVIIV